MTESERIDELERRIRALTTELRVLRARVDRLSRDAEGDVASVAREVSTADVTLEERIEVPDSAAPAQAGALEAPPPSAARPREVIAARVVRTARRQSWVQVVGIAGAPLDLESLIGRYGTLALATLMILMGAAAFLGWAIANGKLGPELRVVLGAIGAAVVAVAGWRLRRRGSPKFGDTLLALSLALVHVDAWGAGPYLQLVPDAVSLGLAGVASLVLAALALHEENQSLFSVGIGGALLAPFVTTRGGGNVPVFLSYGLIVLVAGTIAMRRRPWQVPALLVALGCWTYTAAAIDARPAVTAAMMRLDAPAIFALACAVVALVVMSGSVRSVVAQSALGASLGALVSGPPAREPRADVVVLAALATVASYVTLRGLDATKRGRALIGAVVLPLGLMLAAQWSSPDPWTTRGVVIALGWSAGSVAAALVLGEPTRPLHLLTTAIATGVAVLIATRDHRLACVLALSAHAAATMVAMYNLRVRVLWIPVITGLVIATGLAYDLLHGRTPYAYTPFLTSASLAAAATVAAWLAFSWVASRPGLLDGPRWTATDRTVLILLGPVMAFLWGREELLRAFSRDAAAFLLIFYYAGVGVGAIFVGRSWTPMPALRHVGLALAIYASLKAVQQASTVSIGIRVGSYLMTGLFMLAVAYWYRAKSEEPSDASRDARSDASVAADA